MSKMLNRAKMSVTSTGTGTLTLGSAVLGFQTFANAGVSNGDTISYTIEDGTNWEIGTGTYTSSGTTLSRTVTRSFDGTTYGTSPISVTTSAQVFATALAVDLQSGTSAGNLVALDGTAKLPAVDGSALTNVVASAANITGTLAVANGGTGVTTSTGSGNVVLSTSPTLVTPALGTPTSGTLTSCTGLPLTTGVTGTLGVSNGGTGATTLTGVLKGNGTSAFTAATAGTDYQAAITASGLLKGAGAGSVSAATAGTDYVAPGGALGTPSSGTLTNCTGLPSSGVTGLAASATTDTTNASNISSGTLSNSRLSGVGLTASANTFTSSNTFNAATSSIYLGANSGNLGIATFYGSTSGSVTLKVAAAAGTGTVFQLPSTNGTSNQVLITDGTGVTSWSTAAGGGATGGGSDAIFWNNGQTVTTNYSIPSTTNAGSFGPITINSGVTVTVPSGSNWVVV